MSVTRPKQTVPERRRRAQAAWLRDLPSDHYRGLLGAADLDRLLMLCERFLETRSPEAMVEIEAETYRLARTVEARIGHEATLRCVRDGLAVALTRLVEDREDMANSLARIVARVSDSAWTAHADLLEATIHRQREDRIRHELTVAKRIQERLLPRTVPEVPGFDIAGRVLPAAEIGGDYWSCRAYPEDDIVTFKLADITGHGIAAATLVAAVKFISGGYYRAAKTAAQVMERTNQVLVRETPNEILVTMVYGWLYVHSREMTIVNAGHSPVLHYHRGAFRSIEPTGIALGMMPTRYRETRLTMEPGDILFTCSDGVTEPNASAALGERWVREQLLQWRSYSATEITDRILEAALRTYGKPLDDMSVLVIKCTE